MLTALAAHPRTPAPVLAHLACSRQSAGRVSPDPVRTAVATNPNAPADLLASMLTPQGGHLWLPLMQRDAMTVPEAIALLGDTTHPVPLGAALRGVHDPDDVLVHLALDRTEHVEVASTALAAATTPAGARRAAHSLAAQALRDAHHVKLLRSYASAHPQDLATLVPAIVDPALAAELREQLEAVDPAPGSAPWCGRTSTPERVAWARQDPTGLRWARIVANGPDPDHQIARAALSEHPQQYQVALAVLGREHRPLDVLTAAGIAAAGGPWRLLQGTLRARVGRLITSGPHAVAAAYLRAQPDLHAAVASVSARTDLTPDDLDVVVALAGTDPHQWGQASLGLWLATYPAATAAQVRFGIAWVRRQCQTGTAKRHYQDIGAMEDLAAFVDALEANLGADPAELGRLLPLTLLREHTVQQMPGIRALVDAALEDVVATLDADGGLLLTTLHPTFPGTWGELLSTVAAVTR